MFQFIKRLGSEKMPSMAETDSHFTKPLSVIAVPGMYLFYKYSEFKRHHEELQRKKVTEKELDHLNHKIDKLLAKIDDKDSPKTLQPPTNTTSNTTTDEECVVCMNAKATMQTFPCGHKVVCRKCFVKTIQVAVSQRCLPLKCVICRTRILKLRQSQAVKVSTSRQKSRPSSAYSKFISHAKVHAK